MRSSLIAICILLSTSVVVASKVDTLTIVSKSMNKEIKNIVVTPDSYASNDNPLPVFYVLHGAGGGHYSWLKFYPEIIDYADKYNVILVFPDGDKFSWYFDSPIDSSFRYETYISVELIDSIDKGYNTIDHKNGRAITGLSMGGHGAFYLAFKHTDIWGAAGSISGGLDIRPFPAGWKISERLGTYSEYPENWEQNTIINMTHLIEKQSLQLIFDCGIDDFFYDANKRMHEKLVRQKIPHDYIERPGSHTLDYFKNSIKYHFLFFNDYFQSN